MWRLVLALLIGFAAYELYLAINWPLMWRTDGLSCAAMVCVLLALVLPAILLGLSAVRWFFLACWAGEVGATWSEERLVLRMGPFGTLDLDRARARVSGPPADIPAKFAAEFPIKIEHPLYAGNVADRIMLMTRMQPDALHAALVRHGWVRVDDDEDEG